MKRPSTAGLKRVTPENLARLGAERLAEILVEVAETRVELKRRLRMELAAEQGPDALRAEIDRRLATLAASHGRISWRQRPAFVRDLDGLRGLIAGRLADLDAPAARDRIFEFLALAHRSQVRARDPERAVPRVFARAAEDAVRLIAVRPPAEAGARLAAAIAEAPGDWADWLATALAEAPALAAAALAWLPAREGPPWALVRRRLADAAGDPDRFADTFGPEALKTPSIAAEVAARFLAAGRLEPARAALEGAVQPRLFRKGRAGAPEPDFAWESVWIDWLEASGDPGAAQAARWASFERNLSVERAKAFTARLPDFEDVEAEHRIFAAAAAHDDAAAALDLLVGWPALPEAARLIAERAHDLRPDPDRAQRWAAVLRRRFPAAAETVLRRAAAEAFRRREFTTSTRLTEEADALAG